MTDKKTARRPIKAVSNNSDSGAASSARPFVHVGLTHGTLAGLLSSIRNATVEGFNRSPTFELDNLPQPGGDVVLTIADAEYPGAPLSVTLHPDGTWSASTEVQL